MKVLMINTICGIRSTGRICTDLATALEAGGHEVRIAYGRNSVPERLQKYAVRIGSGLGVILHGARARLLDGSGWGSRWATRRFIDWVRSYDPDVIHLHNLHGYFINLEILFRYLRSCGKRIIWTLHDSWAFTGHAAYCDAAECERWISGCYDCPNRGRYPRSWFDRSSDNWIRKKALVDGIRDLTIVSPSAWLADLAGQSFLKQFPILVIHNGVDTGVFRPVSDPGLDERYGIKGKKVVLGVASGWGARKGLSDFLAISRSLDDGYRVVMIGLSAKQIAALPEEIIGIRRTNSTQELAAWYSRADVFANPTYEDNYPTTNLEAIACGTPVITYDTGGSPESAALYGHTVEKGNVAEMADCIRNMRFGERPDLEDRISVRQMVDAYLRIF